MAEACRDGRRCLPAWMTKACSSNEMSKTEHQNKHVVESDKQSVALDQIKPVRRKSRGKIKAVDTEETGELITLQRCQGRENTKRKSKDAAALKNSRKRKLGNFGSEASSSEITDDEIELTAGGPRALHRCQGIGKARRKCEDADYTAKVELKEVEKINSKKVRGRAAPKNSRKERLENLGSEALSSGTSDDEIELTVEDLVSIAEEIVNSDKEKQQKIRTMKTAQYEERPPESIFTPKDTGGSVSNTGPSKGLMRCTKTTTDRTPSESRVEKNNGHEEPYRPPNIQMTGDIAQDMINMFLAPLLSKPAVCEDRSRPVETSITSTNHAPRKKDFQDVARVQMAPVVKKSSLRDKVDLFL